MADHDWRSLRLPNSGSLVSCGRCGVIQTDYVRGRCPPWENKKIEDGRPAPLPPSSCGVSSYGPIKKQEPDTKQDNKNELYCLRSALGTANQIGHCLDLMDVRAVRYNLKELKDILYELIEKHEANETSE